VSEETPIAKDCWCVVQLVMIMIMIIYTKPENCARLGYYLASSGNLLPTIRDNLLVTGNFAESNGNFLPTFCDNLSVTGNFLPKFRDNQSVPWSGVKIPFLVLDSWKTGPKGLETSVRNYHCSLRNNAEERGFQVWYRSS